MSNEFDDLHQESPDYEYAFDNSNESLSEFEEEFQGMREGVRYELSEIYNRVDYLRNLIIGDPDLYGLDVEAYMRSFYDGVETSTDGGFVDYLFTANEEEYIQRENDYRYELSKIREKIERYGDENAKAKFAPLYERYKACLELIAAGIPLAYEDIYNAEMFYTEANQILVLEPVDVNEVGNEDITPEQSENISSNASESNTIELSPTRGRYNALRNEFETNEPLLKKLPIFDYLKQQLSHIENKVDNFNDSNYVNTILSDISYFMKVAKERIKDKRKLVIKSLESIEDQSKLEELRKVTKNENFDPFILESLILGIIGTKIVNSFVKDKKESEEDLSIVEEVKQQEEKETVAEKIEEVSDEVVQEEKNLELHNFDKELPTAEAEEVIIDPPVEKKEETEEEIEVTIEPEKTEISNIDENTLEGSKKDQPKDEYIESQETEGLSTDLPLDIEDNSDFDNKVLDALDVEEEDIDLSLLPEDDKQQSEDELPQEVEITKETNEKIAIEEFEDSSDKPLLKEGNLDLENIVKELSAIESEEVHQTEDFETDELMFNAENLNVEEEEEVIELKELETFEIEEVTEEVLNKPEESVESNEDVPLENNNSDFEEFDKKISIIEVEESISELPLEPEDDNEDVGEIVDNLDKEVENLEILKELEQTEDFGADESLVNEENLDIEEEGVEVVELKEVEAFEIEELPESKIDKAEVNDELREVQIQEIEIEEVTEEVLSKPEESLESNEEVPLESNISDLEEFDEEISLIEVDESISVLPLDLEDDNEHVDEKIDALEEELKNLEILEEIKDLGADESLVNKENLDVEEGKVEEVVKLKELEAFEIEELRESKIDKAEVNDELQEVQLKEIEIEEVINNSEELDGSSEERLLDEISDKEEPIIVEEKVFTELPLEPEDRIKHEDELVDDLDEQVENLEILKEIEKPEDSDTHESMFNVENTNDENEKVDVVELKDIEKTDIEELEPLKELSESKDDKDEVNDELQEVKIQEIQIEDISTEITPERADESEVSAEIKEDLDLEINNLEKIDEIEKSEKNDEDLSQPFEVNDEETNKSKEEETEIIDIEESIVLEEPSEFKEAKPIVEEITEEETDVQKIEEVPTEDINNLEEFETMNDISTVDEINPEIENLGENLPTTDLEESPAILPIENEEESTIEDKIIDILDTEIDRTEGFEEEPSESMENHPEAEEELHVQNDSDDEIKEIFREEVNQDVENSDVDEPINEEFEEIASVLPLESEDDNETEVEILDDYEFEEDLSIEGSDEKEEEIDKDLLFTFEEKTEEKEISDVGESAIVEKEIFETEKQQQDVEDIKPSDTVVEELKDLTDELSEVDDNGDSDAENTTLESSDNILFTYETNDDEEEEINENEDKYSYIYNYSYNFNEETEDIDSLSYRKQEIINNKEKILVEKESLETKAHKKKDESKKGSKWVQNWNKSKQGKKDDKKDNGKKKKRRRGSRGKKRNRKSLMQMVIDFVPSHSPVFVTREKALSFFKSLKNKS